MPGLNLEIGKCRYGLMLNEDGMVYDDGVTTRLSKNHYIMTTTTGGAANVLSKLEDYLTNRMARTRSLSNISYRSLCY